MRVVCLLVLIAALPLAGCGRGFELGQVAGTVRASGQPAANVVVTFVPEVPDKADLPRSLPRSLAQTDESGRYVLKTEAQQPGAALGRHRVVVEDLAMLSAPRAHDGTVLKRPPVRFSASYSDPLRTPLVVEVKSGEQTIDLDLMP